MNFFDVLAAERWDGGVPTINFFDLLFAQSISGEQWQVYDGTLPATINANGDDMRQYQLWGNVGGVGDRTENRLDYGTVENGYTLTTTTGKPTTRSDGRTATMTPIDVSGLENVTLYFTAASVAGKRAMYSVLDVNDSLLERITNISNGATVINLPSGATKMYISWYMINGYLTKDDIKNAMLTPGTTPPETFVPFGYEVDISTSDGTNVTPIYIGDDPLEKDEYVDYQAQKVYRMIDGTLTPTNPPVPLPALPTCEGTTIVDYAGQGVAPEKVYFEYKQKR